MQDRLRRPLSILALLTTIAALPAKGTFEDDGSFVVRLAGTSLTLVSTVAHQSARIRITGPDGYVVTRPVAAGRPLTIDLLAEMGLDRRQAEASGRRVVPTAGVDPRSRWPSLADGRYRYELDFRDAAGVRRIQSGFFRRHEGALLGPGEMGAGVAALRGEIPGAGAVPGESLMTNVDDVLQLFDTDTNNSTHIFMDGGVNANPNWQIRNDAGDLRLREFPTGTGVDRMTLVGDDLGLGTTAPTADLHIVRGGTKVIFLEDQGATGFPTGWGIAGDLAGGLYIGPANSGGVGGLFVLDAGGQLFLEGDVSLGSSRALKREIAEVAADDLLARLARLPIHSWEYRNDSRKARHIGPMAEDFHELFGLGADDRHLSPADTSGVALIAVKALLEQVATLERAQAETRAELEAVRAELSTLRDQGAPAAGNDPGR